MMETLEKQTKVCISPNSADSHSGTQSGPSTYVFQCPLTNFVTELNQFWLLGARKGLTLSNNSIPLVEFKWTEMELPHDN